MHAASDVLTEFDPELWEALRGERRRQEDHLELRASLCSLKITVPQKKETSPTGTLTMSLPFKDEPASNNVLLWWAHHQDEQVDIVLQVDGTTGVQQTMSPEG